MMTILALIAAIVQNVMLADTPTIDTNQPSAAALEQPQGIVVKLTSDRSSYNVGDDIRIQVTVRNTMPIRLYLPFGGPWGDAPLTIKGSNGTIIAPTVQPDHPVATGSHYSTSIGPLESVSDTRYASGYGPSVTQSDGFVSLRAWGYVLDKPGVYTVTASRYLGRDDAGKEHFVRSNTIDISVTQ